MTFILVPKKGDDLQINGWNWRPTIRLLHAEKIIDQETYERMSAQGCGGCADASLAVRIAEALDRKLSDMKPGQRILYDLTVTDKPKKQWQLPAHTKDQEIDTVDAYSTTYEWLVTFRDFCRASEGFEVY